jgi:hypothetical protein
MPGINPANNLSVMNQPKPAFQGNPASKPKPAFEGNTQVANPALQQQLEQALLAANPAQGKPIPGQGANLNVMG